MCAAPDQLDYFATLALQQRSYQSTSGEGSRINSYCSRIGPRSHWPSPRKRLPSPPIMIHAFPKIFVRLAKFLQTIVIILFVTALTSPYATSAVVTANGFQLKLRTAVCRQRHELLAGTNWHRTREPSIRRLLRSHLRQRLETGHR